MLAQWLPYFTTKQVFHLLLFHVNGASARNVIPATNRGDSSRLNKRNSTVDSLRSKSTETRDQVMDFETWFKIHTNVSNFETASPKTIQTLQIFHQFCENCKIPSCTYYWKEAEMKITMFAHFKEYHGNHEIFRVYMVLGDAVSKLETFVWILSHISRSITWSLFTLKASYLVKWPISKWSFMWRCQFIDWLKFETRPSSLLNFGTAYSINTNAMLCNLKTYTTTFSA